MRPVIAALAAACALLAQGSWKLVYHHDEDRSELALSDLKIGSLQCALASGALVDKGRSRNVVVASRDAGRTWQLIPSKQYGMSLFLQGQTAWMTAGDGLWRSSDCGQTWERIRKERWLLRSWFLDGQHGFAVGAQKKVIETTDGGRSWTKLAAAAEPKADPARSVYTTIHFAGQHGFIIGWHEPERPGDFGRRPDWMDPEAAQRRRQWPQLTLMLQTTDGGRKWAPGSTSLMGKIASVHVNQDMTALALVEFSAAFEWPSEVYLLELSKNQSRRVFREKSRVVTDVTRWGDATFLAAVEPPGSLHQLAIPGKVHILRSADLSKWEENKVDYRAEGRRVFLAGLPGGPLLAATDTGMILRLEP